uniref:Cilia-and flagella-associated protein 96 n=1 Tax=Heterosigma akashiwo TaxID=2829 RepID=A0A7S3Y7S7_HETAK
MRNKAKIRTPNGFRFSSPMKKSASSGDFEGTFYDERSKQYKDQGPLLPHHHQHINFKKGSERNFLTSPLRKGGPGYPARGFGGTDIEYKPEPYDRRRQLARQESALHRKAVGERRAFVSTARRIAQFDDQDHASVSKVYTEDEGCLPPKPDPAAGLTPMEATTTALEAQRKLGVFRPSSPPKTCVIESTFTGFPKFMSEPYDEKGVRAAQKPDRLKPIAVQVEKLPDNIKERKAFMPSAIPKTGLVKSTAKMGLHVH